VDTGKVLFNFKQTMSFKVLLNFYHGQQLYKVTALQACKQAAEQSHPTSRMQG
jgi:hypothetical protein